MDKKTSANEQAPPRRFFQRRSVQVLAFLVVSAAVFLVSLPIGVKIYLERWLEKNGADSATVEKVRFNPFSGIAGLEGVTVEKDGQTVFADSNISIDIGLKNLFSRTALLQQAILKDVVVDIEKNESGSFRIASYTLQPGKDKPVEEKTEETAEKDSAPWVVYAQAVDIENVSVRYRQPDFSAELTIEEAHIENINTDPEGGEGKLMLKGKVNGTPIALDFERFSFLPYLDLDGNVQVVDFPLEELTPFVKKVLEPFSGSAGVDGRVVYKMQDAENINVGYDGSIKLDKGDIGGAKWAVGGTVSWEGKASFTMQSGEMVVGTDGDLQALDASFDMGQPLIDIDNSNILIGGKTEVKVGEEVTIDTSASLTLAPTTYLANGFQTGAGDTSWVGRVLVNSGTEKSGLGVDAEGKFAVAEPVFDMDMEKGQMEIGNGSLVWEGKVEYKKGVGNAEDTVHTNGTLEGNNSFFKLPDAVDVAQGRLVLAGDTTVRLGQPLAVDYVGDFTLERTSVDVRDMSIGDGGLDWSGKIGFQLAPSGQVIKLNGLLKSSDVTFGMAGPELQVVQKQLELKPEFQLQLSEKPSFEGQVGVGGTDLTIDMGSVPLLSLAGVSADGIGGDGSGGIRGDVLQFEGLELHSSERIPVRVEVPGISFSEILSADLMSGTVGRIAVEKPVVRDADGTRVLAGLASITAESVSADKNLVAAVERVVLDSGEFLAEEGQEPMATMKQLAVDSIDYSPSEGLACDAVTIDSVYADILLEESADKDEEPQEETATAETEEAAGSSTLPVKINRIDVVGKTGVKFTNPNLARTFITTFNLDSLKVRDIDFTKPEQPFTYILEGAVDKYTPVKISGQFAPLAENLFIDQEVSINNLSMLHISPYSVEAIGTFFPSGMLDISSSLKIGDGLIDMDNNLVIDDVTSEKVQGELADELDNQLPVPFNLALTLLKDSDGKIDLDVPIKGKLSDIQIGISDLVWTPLSNAITVAVTPYLAYTALGPAGALTYLGAKLGKKMLETHFPVLEFEPGQNDLSDKHKKSLDKAGKTIETELAKNGEKDGAAYVICAKVSISELPSVDHDDKEANQEVLRNENIRRELFKLGESRSLAVKKYLTTTYDIPEERLEICNPGLNFDETAKPVVQFMK